MQNLNYEENKRKILKNLQGEFGVKVKKEISKETIMTSWKTTSKNTPITDINYSIKEAMLSATTSPYLRAVIVIMEAEDTKKITFYEMEEHALTNRQRIGALLNSEKKMVALREIGVTHSMNSSWISKLVFDQARDMNATNVHIINVHHDYIRSFYLTPIKTEDLIWEILYNDHHERKKVIRTVRGG